MADIKRQTNTAPPSWGVMLHQYCTEKRKAPPLESRFRFTRKNGGGVKEKERMFDPVTQRHRNPEIEKNVREKELSNSIKEINKGMKTALTKESCIGYDIVNQQPKFGIQEVVNLGYQAAPKGKRIPPPKKTTNQNTTEALPQPKRVRVRPGQRQYNVLQHRYVANHNETLQSQDKAVRERSHQIISSNYDPIQVRHNNPEKEKVARDAIAKLLEKKKSEYHITTTKTPFIEKRSEGHNYDILNGSVYNKSGVDALDIKLMGTTPHKMRMRQTVASKLSAREVAATKSDSRAVNRISSQRQPTHDYNILTGATSSSFPSIARRQPDSVWGVLSKTM